MTQFARPNADTAIGVWTDDAGGTAKVLKYAIEDSGVAPGQPVKVQVRIRAD